MAREPVPATAITDFFENEERVAGAFEVNENGTRVVYVCPCGCGQDCSLPIAAVKVDRAWEWNQNRKSPTLKPSIKQLSGCKFHGFLTDGMWTFCEDSGA